MKDELLEKKNVENSPVESKKTENAVENENTENIENKENIDNSLKEDNNEKTINKVLKENNEVGVEEKAEEKKVEKISVVRKIKNWVFNTRVFPVLVGVVLLLKTMLLYKTSLFKNESFPIQTYLTMLTMAFLFILLFIMLPMLLKPRARFWTALLINILVSILLCVNEVYYNYSSNLISISQISNLQYGREISLALPNLIHIRQVLYFIDIIAIVILVIAKKIKIDKKAKFSFIPGIIYVVVIMIIASKHIPKWIDEASVHKYNKILQIESSSIYGYHYIDIKNNLNMKKNVKYKNKGEVQKAYNQLKDTYNSKYELKYDFTDIAKGKNVIIVQLESVQNFVVNRKINGHEITPNLNKFMKENIEFSNMHNQSYSSTADSEYGVMNSLYPLENGTSFSQYPANDYNDMYQNFKREDYTTTYIHGNYGGFWNRMAVYSRLKIDNVLFDDVFDEDTERINEYISDEALYKKVVEELKGCDGKFFVNIVAASSHIPFELEGMVDRENKLNFDPGEEYRDMFFGNYLEAVNYADYAFGEFIKDLKAEGLYDDTVILVYGDHAGLQMYNWEMMDFIKKVKPLNDIQTQINYSNVLCGMKIPGVKSMKIDKPTSKLDMKPTLCEICGVEDKFSLGMSMFSDKDFVCLNNGRIITDKYFYDGEWYTIQTGEKVDLSALSQEEVDKLNYYCDCLQKELDISLSINILNLLKK